MTTVPTMSEITPRQVSDDARKAWRHAKGAAEVGQVLCALWVVLGVIGGGVVFFTKDDADTPFGDDRYTNANMGAGIGLALAAVTLGVCLYAAMAWLRWRAEQEAPGGA